MITGMLWFDAGSSPLAEKVSRAAAFYTKKYGQTPDRCFVHPSAGEEQLCGQVRVLPSALVQPHYLWIGKDEA